eukprot:6559057-Prymnesium_polylepis.1
MGGAAVAAAAGGACQRQQQQQQQQQQPPPPQQQQQQKARARSAVVRAQRLVCWPVACARACGDRNLSSAQQPQRMPLKCRLATGQSSSA